LRKKRKEMSARAGAKECCPGTVISMALYLVLRERRGKVLEKESVRKISLR
jgi:hypothetical protein